MPSPGNQGIFLSWHRAAASSQRAPSKHLSPKPYTHAFRFLGVEGSSSAVVKADETRSANREPQELSVGRARGSRCWFRLLGEVPPNALWEQAGLDEVLVV